MPGKPLIVVCSLVVALAAATDTSWAVPSGFNVHGRLTDAQGINRDGTGFSIKFTIYDAASGGTALWSKTFPSLTVKNGNFQAILGDPSDTPSQTLPAAFAGDPRFLEIQVLSGPGISAPEPPMSPRQQLVSVPFALRAATADNGSMVTVQTRVVTESTAVTFSGLAANVLYRINHFAVQNSVGGERNVRFNDDVSSNYYWYRVNGNGLGLGAERATTTSIRLLSTDLRVPPGEMLLGSFDFVAYPGNANLVSLTGTTHVPFRGVDPYPEINFIGAKYTGSAALSSVTIFTTAGTMSGTFILSKIQ